MTRLLPVELLGAALREFLLPALRRLADYCDPSDSAPHNPVRVVVPEPAVVIPDRVPDSFLIEQR